MRPARVIAAMRTAILVATLLGLAGAVQAAAPESIEIATESKPLEARLYRPQGDGPFPAIVALHGCDGLRGQKGNVRKPLDAWGQHLSAAGFVVLFPDSYSSRGLASQ